MTPERHVVGSIGRSPVHVNVTVVSKSRTGKPARMIKNLWMQEFAASGLAPLPMPLQGIVANSVMEAARQDGRKDINPGFAGQGVGMIARLQPAAEVLRQMVAEAHVLLSGKLVSHIRL
jgi:nitronate monooxygenase